jgi:hypothetical protein
MSFIVRTNRKLANLIADTLGKKGVKLVEVEEVRNCLLLSTESNDMMTMTVLEVIKKYPFLRDELRKLIKEKRIEGDKK